MNIDKNSLYSAMKTYFETHEVDSKVDLYVQTTNNGNNFSIVNTEERNKNATCVKVSGLIIKNFMKSKYDKTDSIKIRAKNLYNRISGIKKFKYMLQIENILIKNLDKRVKGKPASLIEKIQQFRKSKDSTFTTIYNKPIVHQVSYEIYPSTFTDGQKAGFQAMVNINRETANIQLNNNEIAARAASFNENSSPSMDYFQENLRALYAIIIDNNAQDGPTVEEAPQISLSDAINVTFSAADQLLNTDKVNFNSWVSNVPFSNEDTAIAPFLNGLKRELNPNNDSELSNINLNTINRTNNEFPCLFALMQMYGVLDENSHLIK